MARETTPLENIQICLGEEELLKEVCDPYVIGRIGPYIFRCTPIRLVCQNTLPCFKKKPIPKLL